MWALICEWMVAAPGKGVLYVATADFVRERTGFVIGGVPPSGHVVPLRTLIDEDLLQYEVIWAAAGHPRAVFQLTPETLVQMTGGQVLSVK
jgi:prolyl-tRNA editing enzyme YbaK/EbsC (Cys-tRNA(Pro) deacylase)